MANTLLTNQEIGDLLVRGATVIASNSLQFGANVSRHWDERFARSGAKIGTTFDVKIPPRYLVTDAEGLVKQDTTQTKKTLTIVYSHIGLEFTQTELVFMVNNFKMDAIRPAVSQLMNRIDERGAELYTNVYNLVGTIGGGAIATLAGYLEGYSKLGEEATPEPDRWTAAINHAQNEKIVDALKGLFHAGPQLAPQYEKGVMQGRYAAGFKWVIDQNMALHTCGTRLADGSPLVNGANQTGASLICDTFGNTLTVKKGDVFTIASVNAVNPQNRKSTGRLRQFRVTADGTSSGAGALTLAIDPPITATGKDQTVTAVPADNAALTFNGAASATGHQGLLYYPEAFSLTFVDEELPNGVDMASKTPPGDAAIKGIMLSLIRDYSITDHAKPVRLGAYYGWLAARPEFACRATS